MAEDLSKKEEIELSGDYKTTHDPKFDILKTNRFLVEEEMALIRALMGSLDEVGEHKLKDRTLQVGDECIYKSSWINGTGYTCGSCRVDKVIDAEKKIYHLVEKEERGHRDWVAQDIDQKPVIDNLIKNGLSAPVQWILIPGEEGYR